VKHNKAKRIDQQLAKDRAKQLKWEKREKARKGN
jgi:hypothetical protein